MDASSLSKRDKYTSLTIDISLRCTTRRARPLTGIKLDFAATCTLSIENIQSAMKLYEDSMCSIACCSSEQACCSADRDTQRASVSISVAVPSQMLGDAKEQARDVPEGLSQTR